MLCALLCTCISVLGGTLIPLQAYLYLGVERTTLVSSSIACGRCCCHLYYCACLTGHVVSTLRFVRVHPTTLVSLLLNGCPLSVFNDVGGISCLRTYPLICSKTSIWKRKQIKTFINITCVNIIQWCFEVAASTSVEEQVALTSQWAFLLPLPHYA